MVARKYKSISRIDHQSKHMHGWYVRVAFRGQVHAHFVNDAQYRTRPAALKAALAWRDAKEQEVGKPRTERTVPALRARNATGVIGVRRTQKAMTRDGKKTGPVYEVTWQPCVGETHRTTFSITKYGEKEAYRRAYAFRKAKEREVYGRELPTVKKRRRMSVSTGSGKAKRGHQSR